MVENVWKNETQENGSDTVHGGDCHGLLYRKKNPSRYPDQRESVIGENPP